jgi:hypothetical protein
MCIDAGDAIPGAIVQPKPCEEKSAQQWDLIVEHAIWNASASIVLSGTSLCLTPPSPYGTDIASVTLQKCVKPSCRQAWLVNAWRGAAAEVSVEQSLSMSWPNLSLSRLVKVLLCTGETLITVLYSYSAACPSSFRK